MNAIIGCEESQAVTIALRAKGIEAYSCDLQECSGGYPDWHLQTDILEILDSVRRISVFDLFDLGGFHPPCTFLTNSSIGWLVRKKEKDGFTWNDKIKRFVNLERWSQMEDAVIFFQKLYYNKGCRSLYIENPVMHNYAAELIGIKPSQIIQPWQFGHMESKATCLWLKNLPKLQPTKNVYKEMMLLPDSERQKMHYLPPSADRAKLRSKTYSGIAEAIATQWGVPSKQIQLFNEAA